MKKLFLFFAASALVVSAVAQKPAISKIPVKMKPALKRVVDKHESSTPFAPKTFVSNTKAVSAVLVGTSSNSYGMFQPRAHQIAYNEQFDLLSYAHRGGPSNGSGSEIFNNFSSDLGATWDTINKVYDDVPSTFMGRFPNGLFFNPTGNTDINNVYSMTAGPIVDLATSNWLGTYFTWQKHSAAHAKQYVFPYSTVDRVDDRSFQICQDGKFYITGENHENDGTYLTKHHFTILSGTLDYANDTVINFTSTQIDPPLYVPVNDTTRGIGSYRSELAFNKSGTVGYFVLIGVRNDIANPLSQSYRPIIYKTTDAGANWTIQPDYNFSGISTYLLKGTVTDTTVISAWFNEVADAAVDANDNLHILSYVSGAYTLHPDSLGYSWGYETLEGVLYDTYMTSGGNWNATMIDGVYTKDVEASSPEFDYNARPKIALSDDGTKIFYAWQDSDPDQVTENVLPDLLITGRNITDTIVHTITNLTDGTSLEKTATYTTVAPQVKVVGTGDAELCYPHAIVTTIGSVDTDPVSYYYLKDAVFSILPVSVNNIDKNLANVSKVYPNPTNGLTNIDVTLEKSTNVSINIVNMMGQEVYAENFGQKTIGKNKLTFNTSDLTSGIYFVTVKAGNSTSTSKMIVR